MPHVPGPLNMWNSLIFVTWEHIAVYENLRMIFLKIVTTLVNGEKEKNVGENNGKLRFVRHHVWHTQARLDQLFI